MNRPRFLGTRVSVLVLAAAGIVVALWLAGVAWMLLDVIQMIIGAKRACT